MIADKVHKLLKEKFPRFELFASDDMHGRNLVTISGEVDTWQDVVDIGHAAAKVEGVKNIVSEMTVHGLDIPQKDYTPAIKQGEEIGVIAHSDVVVVGLGITGCGIMRELSKYDLDIIAVEMGDDVSTAATKANNGGVHMAGQVKPGTLKAELSVRGNALYEKWSEELGFEFVRVGHMTYTDKVEHIDPLKDIFVTAVINRDKCPALLDGEQTLEIAPEIKSKLGVDPVASVWMPSQAKVHPYKVCVALAENAVENGAKILFNCTVGDIRTKGNAVTAVVTNKGIINTRYVIDAAGIYADDIAGMAGDKFFTLHNRKGVIAVIDKAKPPATKHLVIKYNPSSISQKNEESKGGGMDFSPSGNMLIGPSATEVPDKEDTSATAQDFAFAMGRNDDPDVTNADIIRVFAGARPADFKEDFIVEKSQIVDGLIVAGGIQSPGIGSAPAIAERVEQILAADLHEKGGGLERKAGFNPIRKPRIEFADLSHEEQAKLIAEKPEYGRVVCRCETITEGEILDAIDSNVVPTSIDAIKRRTRAGMGRCQGGFCQSHVLRILAEKLGRQWTEINLNNEGTNILKKRNR